MRHIIAALAFSLFWGQCDAANREVEAITDQYAKSLPTEKQLAFYSLDWAADFAEAKARAAREQRPIFFIYITNITAQTSFFSGHC